MESDFTHPLKERIVLGVMRCFAIPVLVMFMAWDVTYISMIAETFGSFVLHMIYFCADAYLLWFVMSIMDGFYTRTYKIKPYDMDYTGDLCEHMTGFSEAEERKQ